MDKTIFPLYNNFMKKWLITSICFFIVIVCIVIQTQNTNSSQTHEITLTDVGFDTPVTFKAECSQEEFETYTEIVREVFSQNNRRFDCYHSYEGMQNIYTVNQEAYDHPVELDDTTMDCVQLALEMNRTCSKFDCTYGALMNLWHEYREQGMAANDKGEDGKLPDQSEIQEALKHGGADQIRIEGKTIHFTDPGIKLDLGGIAKGYTAQKAKEELQEAGLDNGFINAGGNVVLIGGKKNNEPWKIGIQNPDASGSLIVVEIQDDISIVTSGDYQRYYTSDGKRISHIIDIDTGYPVEIARSVTVLAEDSGKADAYSTCLFCLDYQQGKRLAKKLQIDAIWIFDKDKAPSEKPLMKTGNYYIYATDSISEQISLP